jgi:hypothetical protein
MFGFVLCADEVEGCDGVFDPALADKPFRRFVHSKHKRARDRHEETEAAENDIEVSPAHVCGGRTGIGRGAVGAAEVDYERPCLILQLVHVSTTGDENHTNEASDGIPQSPCKCKAGKEKVPLLGQVLSQDSQVNCHY